MYLIHTYICVPSPKHISIVMVPIFFVLISGGDAPKEFFFFFFFFLFFPWPITKGNDWANQFQKMKIAKENEFSFSFLPNFQIQKLGGKKKPNPNFNTFQKRIEIVWNLPRYLVSSRVGYLVAHSKWVVPNSLGLACLLHKYYYE